MLLWSTLGGRSRDEWRENVSADEFADWYAYYLVDPWDQQRADLRAAYTSMVVARVHGNKQITAKDFMPYLIEENATAEEPSTDELAAFFQAVNSG